MPQTKRNNPPRLRRGASPTKPTPEVMAWPRAMPVLAIALIFDALRFMCEWLIFFGPALAGLACTAGVNSILGTSVVDVTGKVIAGGCAAGAAAGGFFGAAAIGPIGMIMAEAVGLIGWMAIGVYLVAKNRRIFRENALWFGGSLLLSEIPFVGSLPFFTATLLKMYSTQIRVEKAAYKKWEAENTARLRQEQERQAFEQSQMLQQQQAEQQAEFDNEWQGQIAQQEEEREEEKKEEEEKTEDAEQREVEEEIRERSRQMPPPRLATVPNYTGKARPPTQQESANDEYYEQKKAA